VTVRAGRARVGAQVEVSGRMRRWCARFHWLGFSRQVSQGYLQPSHANHKAFPTVHRIYRRCVVKLYILQSSIK
jgi:hypothetical protein